MKADKIFFATWGLIIIMAGVCALIGLSLQWNVLNIILMWLISVGFILILAGLISIKTDRKTAIYQIFTGELLVAITFVILSMNLAILNIYVSIAIIVVIIGGTIIVLGLLRRE